MPKKTVQAKKTVRRTTASQDALMLGGLYLLIFMGFQILNFLSSTMQDGELIDMASLKTKLVAQFLAFLAGYFITLIYVRNRVE